MFGLDFFGYYFISSIIIFKVQSAWLAQPHKTSLRSFVATPHINIKFSLSLSLSHAASHATPHLAGKLLSPKPAPRSTRMMGCAAVAVVTDLKLNKRTAVPENTKRYRVYASDKDGVASLLAQ